MINTTTRSLDIFINDLNLSWNNEFIAWPYNGASLHPSPSKRLILRYNSCYARKIKPVCAFISSVHFTGQRASGVPTVFFPGI